MSRYDVAICRKDERTVKGMKFRKKLLTIAVLLLFISMIFATQYAVTIIGYEFYIRHPSDSNIRYVGSDNSSDGIRVLRIVGSNTSDIGVKLQLGKNLSTNQISIYSAAFGIVNEEGFILNITHINITSTSNTYMRIWLHGDRDANANSTVTDNSSVLMWGNETQVNASNTTAWTLAPGDNNPSNMCYNISDRANCSIDTAWDETAHVRYSNSNHNAVSRISDFVWVQIELHIPETADHIGLHTGFIWIHFIADTLV